MDLNYLEIIISILGQDDRKIFIEKVKSFFPTRINDIDSLVAKSNLTNISCKKISILSQNIYCDKCQHNFIIKSPLEISGIDSLNEIFNAYNSVKILIKKIKSPSFDYLRFELSEKELNSLLIIKLKKTKKFQLIIDKIRDLSPSLTNEIEKRVINPIGLIKYIEPMLSKHNCSIEAGGIYYEPPANNNKIDKQEISNFIPIIVNNFNYDDGLNQDRFFVLVCLLYLDNRWQVLPQVKLLAHELNDFSWVLSKWGAAPRIIPAYNNTKKLKVLVQEIAGGVCEDVIFTHIGWKKINGKNIYLHSSGAIGSERVNVELEQAVRQYSFKKYDVDIKEAIQTSLSILYVAPPEITYALLAICYLSILCEKLREDNIEPKFLLWLYGTTGTRKTTLALLLMSHFGEFTSPPASFKDTSNGLEAKMFVVKDSLLLIDDFHPSSFQHERDIMSQKAESVLRGYGDRVAKGRMTSDIRLNKEYPPRGMCIVTGEDVVSGESSTARLIGLELQKNSIDLKLLSELQAKKHFLNSAMLEFIKEVSQNYETLDLKSKFYEYRQQNQNGSHGRFAESIAFLKIGFEEFMNFAEEKQAISTEEKEEHLQKANEAFMTLLNKQKSSMSQEKPVELFLKSIKSLIESNQIKILDAKSVGSCNEFGIEQIQKHVGYDFGISDQYIYFIPETIYNEVSQFFKRENKCFPISSKALHKALAEEDCIKVETENNMLRYTVKKTICGSRIGRYLAVKKSKLN